MKKVYSAPEILFESFTMSTNIAGDCEWKPDTANNYNNCGINFSGVIIFGSDLTGCTGIQIAPGDKWDSICYHVPSESSNIFNS